MTKNKIIPILNVLSFIIMLVINYLGMSNLIGYSTKEISDSIPSLLMPIGLTFSIVWSVIYLFLLIFTVYQLIVKNDRLNEEVGVYYLTSNLLNALWVITFHNKMYFISMMVIIFLLIVLNRIVNELKVSSKLPKITFSIYYGWITVATVVSMFSWISSVDPPMFNSLFMKILTAIAIVGLMLLTIIRNKDYPYVLTIVVAMIGILLKHIIDFQLMYPELVILLVISLIGSIIPMIINIISDMNNRKSKKLLNMEA